MGGGLFIGWAAQQAWVDDAATDALVAKRVAQALGEWTPPPLSPEQRRTLQEERVALVRELVRLEERKAGGVT